LNVIKKCTHELRRGTIIESGYVLIRDMDQSDLCVGRAEKKTKIVSHNHNPRHNYHLLKFSAKDERKSCPLAGGHATGWRNPQHDLFSHVYS